VIVRREASSRNIKRRVFQSIGYIANRKAIARQTDRIDHDAQHPLPVAKQTDIRDPVD